ncbi:IS30 family transposase [Persicobacter diffluens]|uniref:IS30 family transposase n=1 Tax=Persicobacter diffluens TaxID=981 RepID=UPI003B9825F3
MFNRSIIPVKTLTCDNGKEFACHEKLETTLGCPVYFADPYASWQRGTNENTNGLIRQFFPKGKCLNETTLEHVNHVENLLNTRPRKVLNYYSTEEKLHNQLIPIIGSRKCCI